VTITATDNGLGFGEIPSGGLGLPAVAKTVVKHGGRTECSGGGVRGSCIAG
jgi:hypothetical protein